MTSTAVAIGGFSAHLKAALRTVLRVRLRCGFAVALANCEGRSVTAPSFDVQFQRVESGFTGPALRERATNHHGHLATPSSPISDRAPGEPLPQRGELLWR